MKVIARDAGYARESDFDSWFRRFTRRSPTEWRLRCHHDSADWRRQIKWLNASTDD
jgi:AraC-like DNA-binding protein